MNVLRLFIFPLLFLMSCPAYEDTYSGTYRENTKDKGFSGEARSLEIFRFGDHVQALVRYYKTGANPFEREARCVWTSPAHFSEEGFRLPLIDSRERIDISGKFVSEDMMELSFDIPDGRAGEGISFKKYSNEASAKCETIEDTLISANFDFEGNRFAPNIFQLKNPVFVFMWLGVDIIKRDTIFTFAKTQRKGPWARISKSHRTNDHQGLKGVLHFFLPPPDESVLTSSGSTRFAMGHPIVIEDEEKSLEDFELDIKTEPIIATTLKKGTLPNISPEGTNNFGRAILFVEGSLLDLDAALVRKFKNIESLNVEQHFYIVDIFSRNDEIKILRFDASNNVEMNIIITDAYLKKDELQLPRLVPLTL